jgi:hypothetical protein
VSEGTDLLGAVGEEATGSALDRLLNPQLGSDDNQPGISKMEKLV